MTLGLARDAGDQWRSLDTDPQYIFSRPPAGTSFLTFVLDARPDFVRPQLFFDWGDDFQGQDVVDLGEAQIVVIRLRLGDSAGLRRIRLDPTDELRAFKFTYIADPGAISWSDEAARMIDQAREQGFDARLHDLELMDYAPAWPGRTIGLKRAPRDAHEHFLRTVEVARREFLPRIQSTDNEARSAPLISFVVPVYNTPPAYLDDLLQSFRGQPRGLAELVLSDDGSTAESTIDWLAHHSREPGVLIHRGAVNGGIAAASNAGIAVSRGEWIGFVDHDDALAPHAVLALERAIEQNPDTKFIYTDELIADKDLRGVDCFFKPAFDEVLLSGVNYINHLSLYRRDRLLATGCFRSAFDGSQDYDLLMRYLAGLDAAEIRHLPYPAYIWRRDGVSYSVTHLRRATKNARRAISEAYSRPANVVPVEPAIDVNLHRPRFDALFETFPKVSIVIPNKNSPRLIRRVLDGLFNKTNYPYFEIIVVDNGTTDPEVLELYDKTRKHQTNFRALVEPASFNFSRQVNIGINLSSSEFILLLNNDIEVIEQDWLLEMVSCFHYPRTGVVGARLLFPNRSLQHAGVIVGLGDLAGHWFVGQHADTPGPMSRLNVRSSMSAVTGACMLISRTCLQSVGLFDERNFGIAYNDVDFCLRAREGGFRTVYTPFATLVHHESVSRGRDDKGHNRPRFLRDQAELLERHGTEGFVDPAYSPWWGRDHSEPYSIVLDELPRAR
jgi:GT2 family glycosyltransferase